VAAKNLLGAGFRVTIFDSKDRVGGLWPVRKDEVGGLVHPLMVANQSRHTMQFSDLAWEDEAGQLPRAWQVGKYLERYRDRYCKDVDIKLGYNIAAAEPVSDVDHDGQSSAGWRLIIETGDGERERLQFDYLLVATGFFGRPALPDVPLQQAEVPVIHSSAYRDLSSLLMTTGATGKKILVVGGQMSGVEISGTIATHLSSAANSPGPSCIPEPESYSVHHVIQRPVWVFPLHTSPNVCKACGPC
jgi:cation diffusion facilitator CzcD-associated flavoprotein CzcO